jgi:hypothetical protein
MSQGVVTTPPARLRHRAIVIAVGLFAVLGIGVAAALAAITSAGSESGVPELEVSEQPVPIAASLRLCGNDPANLLATIRTMPPTVQAQVVASLSGPLSDGLGTLASNIDPSALPPTPDPATLGAILTRVDRHDRNTILGGLPEESRTTVTAAWQAANTAEFLSSTAAPCS